jgi:nicotinamidase-related amidase
MYSLVVVDMQSYFAASRFKRVRQVVLWEVHRARQHGWPIVLLEADDCGQTLGSIRLAVKDYHRAFRMTKWEEDGSDKVAMTLEGGVTRSKSVRVVGVNTDQCVYATVAGLRSLGYQVTVNALGCNSTSHNYGLYLLSKIEGVTIVNRVASRWAV